MSFEPKGVAGLVILSAEERGGGSICISEIVVGFDEEKADQTSGDGGQPERERVGKWVSG
jgi:hypothetical protein